MFSFPSGASPFPTIRRRRGTPLGLILLAALAIPAGTLQAQLQLKHRYFTSGSAVRRAFSDAIQDAKQSTIAIRGEDGTACLGVVIDSDGWVLTKASDLPDQFQCRIPDRDDDIPARVAATNKEHDLALIKLEAENLTPIEWETSSDPRVGQWVITPGLKSTPIAVGVVSVDRRAVPLRRIPGVLGIEMEQADGLPQIRRVFPHSGAESAGLQVGDIIEKLNGEDLHNRIDLGNRVRKHNPGETIKLVIRRGDEIKTIEATLTHPFGAFLSRIAMQNHMGGPLSKRRSGFPAVIQHDSVLRPRDCGGPAVMLSGKAFGINIARAGRTETYVLPADVIIPVAQAMLESATETSASE